jgi:hypothetical protein
LQQIWANKIEERVLNLRRRASRNNKRKCLEEGVVIPKGKPGRKRSKKQATVSFPSIPERETEETIKAQKKLLVEMFNNGSQDLTKVKVLMDNTFPQRRREVLISNVRVWKLLNEYPFFKNGKGVEVSCLLI